ncbi:MAG TPA: DUF748 domain-containing protein, partial [Rhizomicrobium sp.]|nr:DUF748 domain-containing protein [Rhizomicrobium sp.]
GLALNLSLPRITAAGLSVTGDQAVFRGSASVAQLNASIGSFALNMNDRGLMRLTAAMPKLTLQGLNLTAPDGAGAVLQLADLSLDNSELDFAARKLSLGNLTLGGVNLSLQRQRDGKISLLNLLPPNNSSQPPAASPQPWQIALKQVALKDSQLHFEDLALAHPVRLDIAPLALDASGAGSDLSQPVTIHFDAGLNGKGHAVGDAAVTPSTLLGDLKFTLSNLDIRPLAAYMPQLQALELRSGEAGASGTLHFEGANLKALRFSGNAAIANFNIIETSSKNPLFRWQSFALKGIDLRNNRVSITAANLVRPVGQVMVLADRSFNFAPLVPPKNAAAKAVPIQTTPAPSAWMVQLKQLDISGGSMGFSDLSIQPNFSARIDGLKGSIGNISNAPGAVAAIDLSGQVIDQFSPVTIKGAMDLTAYDRKTDMQLAFHNIELPVFDPYSGRYAGYAIAKGKLTTELSYQIDNRVLKADHHVIIDQLEWGQATDSKDAVPLPIRLATSLLKDKNGTIDLDLPVTGSLDDPKFSIWPLVWQVVGNVIEKAVTAPFRLIGSLFEGADKAQYIDFAPGSASLPQGSAEALSALAKALNQRPELKLDIPAGPGIREDATAAADAALDQALLANSKGKITGIAALDLDDQHDWLEDIYRARLGKKPAFPEFSEEALKAAPGAKADADEDDRRTLLECQWMRGELRPSFTPGAAELAGLGTARATAVRNAILADGSVDPARVFMAAGLGEAANDGHARMELKFE